MIQEYAPHPANSARTLLGRSPNSNRVLVVDDFREMRAALRQMLLELGFERITLAANGADALAALRAKRCQIILCDYNLGDGIDGQQVLEQARAEGRITIATAVLMVSAESTKDMVIGALESAPDAYLCKPLTKDLLWVRLYRALRKREPLLGVARALEAGATSSALRQLDELLARRCVGRLELLRIRAELALTNGDWVAAEAACTQALALGPQAWALTCRGRIAEQRGDLAEAKAQYRNCIAITPHFMPAHDRLAALCEVQGRPQEALQVLAGALRRSPKSLPRQRRMARLATRCGDDNLAEPAWRWCIAMAEQMGLPDAVDYLGLFRVLRHRGESEAIRRRIAKLRRRCRYDPELDAWMVAARLNALAGLDRSSQAQVWRELDAMLDRVPLLERAGAALAEAVAAWGRMDAYPSLAAWRDQQVTI